MSSKRKTSTSKKHVSSDEEDNLTISDEDVEFLDQGVVKKVKKPSARLRKVNSNTPCWKFFEIPQGQERGSKCKKCEAIITCVDKKGKLSTTGLNAHLRGKHGNQLDVGATLLIRDIEKMENPTPRAKITSMLKTVSKEEQVERYDRKSPKFIEITRALFHWQTHAKVSDNVVEDGFFHNFLWALNKRYLCPSKTDLRESMLEESYMTARRMITAYIQEHTDGIWMSSDVWWSKYGRFNFMSVTGHHVDSSFKYRTFPIAMRNFPG